MSSLNIVQLTALAKLVEMEIKKVKAEGQEVPVGNHEFDGTVQFDGALSRGEATKVSPTFSLDKFLKPVMLRYAATLGDEEAKKWIASLMSVGGALGAVIQLGSENVLKTVDPSLLALWDAAEKQAKERFQEVMPKADRAGNTVVVGNLTPLGNSPAAAESSKPKRGKK